jgi:hypothetical protein
MEYSLSSCRGDEISVTDVGFSIHHVFFACSHHLHYILRYYSPAETDFALSVVPLCFWPVAPMQVRKTPIAVGCCHAEHDFRYHKRQFCKHKCFAEAANLNES